ncbi:hypothetical protein PR202_gb23112 [Eleusine coracana subsp. coracana]|uniref:Uncharacterized protein n=1 Tax=Eleusine coracana subsp. coracana TaxID=191504 RepID=A0AAV5FJ32_ELECO|nr:hypothetical protein PR202_gb23112 [Eleusine coracana subsp. coracana]
MAPLLVFFLLLLLQLGPSSCGNVSEPERCIASASRSTSCSCRCLTRFSFSASMQVYIVYMGERDPELRPALVRDAHHGMLAAVLGSEQAAKDAILYSYRHGFSGFAAVLTDRQAVWLAAASVIGTQICNAKMEKFLVCTVQGYGQNQLVLEMMASVQFHGGGKGSVSPETDSMLLTATGAKWYVKGYEAEYGKMNTTDIYEFMSARDAVGHGTHTASTAAGAVVADANFRGLASGVARGGAPRARLAVYKVCWATGDCTSADILAAFDEAIHDGVDVLSVSLGQAPPLPAYVDDVLSIGSFHAVAKGIVVVCSAGNSGPYSETVINSAPWIVTVAAGTIDRTFYANIILGNNSTYIGQTLYSGKHPSRSTRLVYAEDIASNNADDTDARSCTAGSLNSTLVKGNVVLCFQTRAQRKLAHSSDIQLLQPDIAAPGVNILAAWTPAASISSAIGPVNFKIDSGTSMSCPHISGVVALLKSMHPNWSPAAVKSALVTTANVHDQYGFEIISEAAPYSRANPFDYGGGHVDPNKAAHPGLVYDMGTLEYVRFLCSMGYNNSAISSMTQQYATCQHTPKSQLNLNLPSITIPQLRGKLTVSRTVTNVGPAVSIYRARVEAPPGVDVAVSPWLLTFNSTVSRLTFKATFQTKLRVQGRYTFGSLTWEDGTHTVRIPLVVRTMISKFYANA